MSLDDEHRQLDSARRALVAEFAGQVPADQVEQRFAAIVQEYRAAPVRSFVPVLVQRQARQHLRSGAH